MQRKALSQSSFKIFNASAGTGKTFALVKEYLKILLTNQNPKAFRQILAITFTNKAANEMKGRLLKSLHAFARNDEGDSASTLMDILSTEMGVTKATIRERAAVTLRHLLHNYAQFEVSTIDKFTHRVIRTFARDLKISQNFNVILETEQILEEAVNSLMSKSGYDEELTELLVNFSLERAEEESHWDLTRDLIKMSHLYYTEEHRQSLDKLTEKEVSDFTGLRKTLFSRIKMIESEMRKTSQEILTLLAASGLSEEAFPYKTLPTHFTRLSEGQYDLDKLYGNTLQKQLEEGNILKKGWELPDDTFLLDVREVYFEIKGLAYQRAFYLNIVKNLLPLTVLNRVIGEVKEIEKEQDLLPIAVFNSIIAETIKDQPAPFIYERLGEQYRHYFIDEFQDTSELQWHNLIPLIGNALEGLDESGRSGSLLLVGDVKQAIYRWRGGKAEQLLNLINKSVNPFSIEPEIHSLDKNFRSRSTIVDFNNNFFKVTCPRLKAERYRQLFSDATQQQTQNIHEGIVRLEFIPSDSPDRDEAYFERVSSSINEILSFGHNYGDICILTRKHKEGVKLADRLMQQEIPIVSSETLLLKNNQETSFAINVMSFCLDGTDLDAFYGLAAYLIGSNSLTHGNIKEAFNNPLAWLEENFKFHPAYLLQLSAYDALEYIISHFDLTGRADGYLNFLLDEAMEVEQKQGATFNAFLQHWRKNMEKLSIAAPDTIDAVRIMTIHKAKGLEFPFVIFPYANSPIYGDRDAKIWMTGNEGPFGSWPLLLVDKKKEMVNYSPEAAELFEDEQHRLELDAFNLLYVALTRAKTGLFVISEKDLDKKGNPKDNYFSGLFIHYLKSEGKWEAERMSYSIGAIPSKKGKAEDLSVPMKIDFLKSSKSSIINKLAVRGDSLWDSEGRVALDWGNLVHNTMSRIESREDVERVLQTVSLEGKISPEQLPRLRNTITSIVEHPVLAGYFEQGISVYNEREIVTENGVFLRPDRMVFDNENVVLIDYKTGRKDPGHKEQILSYANAIEKMGYLVTERLIVYIDREITPEYI